MSTGTLPRRPAAPSNARGALGKGVAFGEIRSRPGDRVVLYGPGGIGKTTLATSAPGPVAYFDFDDALPTLRGQLEGRELWPVEGVRTFSDLQAALLAGGWDQVKTIVLDSATVVEELAMKHVFETIPCKSGKASRVEHYDYGKGYVYCYETFVSLLPILDAHRAAGRHVILVCHDVTASVPNPLGEDYIRFEPRLQTPSRAGSQNYTSVRLRVREWADHVIFLGYDIHVKDGKGVGGGTVTAYPRELPHCMAKSRTIARPVLVTPGSAAFWNQLFQ